MAGLGGVAGMIFAKAETKTQAAYAGAGAIANESIGGMRTVQSFNLHNTLVCLFVYYNNILFIDLFVYCSLKNI